MPDLRVGRRLRGRERPDPKARAGRLAGQAHRAVHQAVRRQELHHLGGVDGARRFVRPHYVRVDALRVESVGLRV